MTQHLSDVPCRVFNLCGGCTYQDLTYPDELGLKQKKVRGLFSDFSLEEEVWEEIVPSPSPYFYRHRLDLNVRRLKSGERVFGFVGQDHQRVIEPDTCYLALPSIAQNFPRLKREILEKFPMDYRRASVVVKSDESGRIFWGGIGKKSLVQEEKDYFYITLQGRKIFYALDTFFQANLGILPHLFEKIQALPFWSHTLTFLDLYGGVGLFSLALVGRVGKIILIEEHPASIRLAQFNFKYHSLKEAEIISGRVEDHLPTLLVQQLPQKTVAMIDPPRKGLSESTRRCLGESALETLLYLSCNPESLVRDLKALHPYGWRISKIIPFDFFPRTPHLEILVLLHKNKVS